MEKQGFRGVMLLLIFIWAGMLLGISFLEAPLKFQAPNITLALGLGIGRLVFGVLNKIEIVFCLSLVSICIITQSPKWFNYTLGFISLILIYQTFWLLPILDARAQIIIEGGTPREKSPHLYYVIAESIKIITLISAGLKLFSETVKNNIA